MEQLLGHVAIALVISALVSVAIETFKDNLTLFTDKELSGRTYFLLSIILSLVVSFGYTMYYQGFDLAEATAIYTIVVLGAQGFHQVLLDDKENE